MESEQVASSLEVAPPEQRHVPVPHADLASTSHDPHTSNVPVVSPLRVSIVSPRGSGSSVVALASSDGGPVGREAAGSCSTPAKKFGTPLAAIPERGDTRATTTTTHETITTQVTNSTGDAASNQVEPSPAPTTSASTLSPPPPLICSTAPPSPSLVHSQSQSQLQVTPSRSPFGTPMSSPGGLARAATIPDSLLRAPAGSSGGSTGGARALGLLGRVAPGLPVRQPSAPSTPQMSLGARADGGSIAVPPQSRSAQSSPANMLAPSSTARVRRPSTSLLSSEVEAAGLSTAVCVATPVEPAGMRPDAFLSYSRRDIHFVRRLYQHFDNAGRNVWIDFKNIPSAVDFMAAIRSGIRESNSFIYVISPDSVASKYCDAELACAIEYGKRIIPLVIREVHAEKVRPEIGRINWIFCLPPAPPPATPAAAGASAVTAAGGTGIVSPPTAASSSASVASLHEVFPVLLESVLVDPAHVLMHTKLLVRAMEWQESGEDPSFLATGRELEEANKWMARSRTYASQQAAHAKHVAASGGLVGGRSRSGLLLGAISAPAPTRVQKLFVFASSERVADAQRKERLLQKFLEADEERDEDDEDEEEDDETSTDEDADDLVADVGESHDRCEPMPVNHGLANGRTVGAGSVLPRAAAAVKPSGATPEHGSLGPARRQVPVAASHARTSSTSAARRKAAKRRSTGGGSSAAGGGGGSSAARPLPHLSSSSAHARFHRRDLRRVLAAQNDLMASFARVVQARETARVNAEAEAEARAMAAVTEALRSPPFASPIATPPPPAQTSGPSVKATRFDSVRFALFECHESGLFAASLQCLMMAEAFLIFFSLVLVIGGFASSADAIAHSVAGTHAIRPLRVLMLITASLFALEHLVFIAPIHAGWRRLRRQGLLLACAALVIVMLVLDGISWSCKGLEVHSDELAPSSSSFSRGSCHGNLFLWALIVRSWHLGTRMAHARLAHPLALSAHRLHVGLAGARTTVAKLKQMVSLLRGEAAAAEAASQMKWEKLKTFHPSRRFSKIVLPASIAAAATTNNTPPNGLATGGAAGLGRAPLAPPSAAELAQAAATGDASKHRAASARLGAKATRTLPIGVGLSEVSRRASMMDGTPPKRARGGGAGRARAALSPRYSTMNPAGVLHTSEGDTPIVSPSAMCETPIIVGSPSTVAVMCTPTTQRETQVLHDDENPMEDQPASITRTPNPSPSTCGHMARSADASPVSTSVVLEAVPARSDSDEARPHATHMIELVGMADGEHVAHASAIKKRHRKTRSKVASSSSSITPALRVHADPSESSGGDGPLPDVAPPRRRGSCSITIHIHSDSNVAADTMVAEVAYPVGALSEVTLPSPQPTIDLRVNTCEDAEDDQDEDDEEDDDDQEDEEEDEEDEEEDDDDDDDDDGALSDSDTAIGGGDVLSPAALLDGSHSGPGSVILLTPRTSLSAMRLVLTPPNDSPAHVSPSLSTRELDLKSLTDTAAALRPHPTASAPDSLQLTSPPSAFSPRLEPTPPSDPLANAHQTHEHGAP